MFRGGVVGDQGGGRNIQIVLKSENSARHRRLLLAWKDILLAAFVTTSEFTKKDKPNCLLAIELMRSMLIPDFKGVSFEKGEKIDLAMGGIVIRVVTDATLSWVDANGIRYIGAIKAKVKKGLFPREASEMTACLVAQALKAKHPDVIVDPLHCFCFDVFRQRLVPASNLSRNLEVAKEIAEIIASMGDLAA